MVFCNIKTYDLLKTEDFSHNPYFNRWFSAMGLLLMKKISKSVVTILILIDGFLQFMTEKYKSKTFCSHNPYFNRWFSAI